MKELKDLSQKNFLKILYCIFHTPTFALPIQIFGLGYVSENQNKITILRSQPGR